MTDLTPVSIAVSFFLVVLGFFRIKLAIGLLLILTLLSPNISIASLSFRIESLLVPVLGTIFIISNRRLHLSWLVAAFLVFWLWLLLSTLLGLMQGTEGSIAWITIYGIFRFVLVIALFASVGFSQAETIRLLQGFVLSAIPLGILGIAQLLDIGFAVWLTLEGYTSPGRGSIAALLALDGTLGRTVSVFESATFAANYYLLAFGSGIWLLLHQQFHGGLRMKIALVLATALAFLGGIMTLSASFIAGLGVLLAWLALTLRWKIKLRLALALIGLLALSPFVFWLVESSSAAGGLTYQWTRLTDGDVFRTRFDGETGLLAGTVRAIMERPINGWGFLIQEGVFVGDSTYAVWLYYGGLIGLFLFLGIMLGIAAVGLRSGSVGQITILWLVLLMALSAGSPSFLIPRLADWWWALAAITMRGHTLWRQR